MRKILLLILFAVFLPVFSTAAYTLKYTYPYDQETHPTQEIIVSEGVAFRTPPIDIAIPDGCQLRGWTIEPHECFVLCESRCYEGVFDNIKYFQPDTEYIFHHDDLIVQGIADCINDQSVVSNPVFVPYITCDVKTDWQRGNVYLSFSNDEVTTTTNLGELYSTSYPMPYQTQLAMCQPASYMLLASAFATGLPETYQAKITEIDTDSDFVGFSSSPDGSTGLLSWNNDTMEQLTVDLTCTISEPNCRTLYAIWNPPITRLGINIDWNGGTITGLMDEPLSGVWSFSDAFGISDADLAQISGMDIYAPLMDAYGNDIVAVCQDPDSGIICENPGYRLVGFSPSPDGKVENPTCIYPECNTLYAVWSDGSDLSFPEPGIDWQGGTVISVATGEVLSGFTSFIGDIDPGGLIQLYGTDLLDNIAFVLTLAFFEEDIASGKDIAYKKGYKFVGWGVTPDTVIDWNNSPKCIYPECHKVYAIWDALPLCPVYKNIKTKSGLNIPLYATKNTTPSIVIRHNDTMCYADLLRDASAGAINIKYNGQIYHTVGQ